MKIFGIGLSKTGTTSLAAALEILGYRVKDYPGVSNYVPGDLASIDPVLLEQYDALTDTPIPSFYRELDRRFSGAKFILTVRDVDTWLKSCRKQFTAKLAEKQNEAHNRLFVEIYGTAVFEEEGFRRGYQRFVDGVLKYFERRPGDLLVLNVAAGQGWPELCSFLGRPTPDVPFPKANVTRIQWMDVHELAAIAKEAGQALLLAHRSSVSERDTPPGPLLGSLVRKAVYSLGGGRPFALQSATAAAFKTVARRLARLNPDIPVVSRLDHDVPAGDRRRWNHFWLIDPLDGESGFGTAEGEFTIDIALIEDQKPIVGVVHAPLSATTYFAMSGKGAFKVIGDGTASPLSRIDRESGVARRDASAQTPSTALALCQRLEAGLANGDSISDSMEWQTAAPHAIANLIGRRLVVDGAAADLSYNKTDWRNPRLRIA